MKILIVSPTQGLINRGAEYSSHLQAEGLSNLGNDVLVIGSGKVFSVMSYRYLDYKQKKEDYFYDGGKNILHKVLNRMYLTQPTISTIKLLLKARKDMTKFSPEVIVANNVITLLICKILFRNSKFVSFGHAGIGFHTFDILRFKPDLFVSLTPNFLEYKKRIRGNTKLVYIPNGIDLDLFKEIKIDRKVLNRTLGNKDNLKVVICVAALTPYKRVSNLIEATSKLKSVFLLIAGDGELKQELAELAKKKIGERFLIKTFPKDAMVEMYNLADVLVLPSEEKEAFGNVILEALACNTPVVVNRDPIRKKIVGKGVGILTDCSDPNSIADSIAEVIRTDYSSYPRRRALDYDFENIAKQIDIVLRDL